MSSVTSVVHLCMRKLLGEKRVAKWFAQQVVRYLFGVSIQDLLDYPVRCQELELCRAIRVQVPQNPGGRFYGLFPYSMVVDTNNSKEHIVWGRSGLCYKPRLNKKLQRLKLLNENCEAQNKF